MLLIKPYLGCNISCKYCYEKPHRENYDTTMKYDLDLIIKTMEDLYGKPRSGQATPCLHGGEILCLPKKDVEVLLKKTFELAGQTSIQTNATKIDGDFIEMFKKYKTNVGISWDGPGDLSSSRPGTGNVGDMMKRLVKEGVAVSNIIVVSKANAGTSEKRAKLKKWLLELKEIGVDGRINPCTNSPANELSTKDLRDFYLDLADFLIKNDMKWSPLTDIINGLKQKSRVCVFSSCDFFNTPSATVILGDGTVTSCLRTTGAHILWMDGKYYKTREEILSQVPQEHGGCKDCRFFLSCYGGCPTTAIDKDWRNKTYLCSVWKGLFEYYERMFKHLGIPILEKGSTSSKPGEGRGYTDGGHYDALHGDHFDAQKGEEGDPVLEKGLTSSRPGEGRGYTDGGHYDALHGDHFDGQKREEDEKVQNREGTKYLNSHGDSPHLDHSDGGLKPKDGSHQDDAFIYNDSGHNDANHGDHFDNDNF